MTDHANAARPRRAATVFIFITVVLDVLAMGMVVPVLPSLIAQVGGVSGAHRTVIFGIFGAVWAVAQLFASPVQGALSDRFGRRPVILASNLGMGANYILMAVAPNLAWLFVGRVISGVASGSMTAAMAYLADINPPEKRAASFGLLSAAFGLGFAMGPAIGGLLGAWGPRAPFWAAAALSLLNFLYGTFVLPESLPRERRAPLDLWRLNPVGALLALARSNPALTGLLAVGFLFTLASQGPNNVFVIYVQDRYHWTVQDVGLLMTAFGVCGMIVQGGLIRLVVPRLGERTTLILGGVTQVVGLTVFGLADTGAKFWLGLPIFCLGSMAGPSWSAIMSRQVGPSEQGRLAGAITSISSIVSVLSPLLFTQAFAKAETPGAWLPLGAPFFMSAALMALCMGLVAAAARKHPTPQRA